MKPTLKSRNNAFYLLARFNCDSEEHRKLIKAYVDAANNHNLYVGDLIDAIGELIRVVSDDSNVRH